MALLTSLLLTHSLLSPPSIIAGEVANLTSPNASIWRQQSETLARENERLHAEIKRLRATRTYEVTAYTSGYESTQKQAGDAGYGITASGTKATEGLTIACPKTLAFGTRLDIEGIGVRICEDRGGAITSGHLDVYFNSVADAQSFGRQFRKAEIK